MRPVSLVVVTQASTQICINNEKSGALSRQATGNGTPHTSVLFYQIHMRLSLLHEPARHKKQARRDTTVRGTTRMHARQRRYDMTLKDRHDTGAQVRHTHTQKRHYHHHADLPNTFSWNGAQRTCGHITRHTRIRHQEHRAVQYETENKVGMHAASDRVFCHTVRTYTHPENFW